jgi:hypothetical protein
VAACLTGAKATAEATRDAMITDFILETLFDEIVNERNKTFTRFDGIENERVSWLDVK